MSKDYRHGQAQLLKSSKRRNAEPTPRLVKTFSEHRAKNLLRDAVKFQDLEFYEEYNEEDAVIEIEHPDSGLS